MTPIPDITFVAAIDARRLHVRLSDGREGEFDVSPYWNALPLRELQNPVYFKQVSLAYGAVTWPHEQDISPDTIAAHLQPICGDSPQSA